MKTFKFLKIFSNSSYKANYAYAKGTNTCIKCGKLAKEFQDASARLEYRISALCQACQEEIIS